MSPKSLSPPTQNDKTYEAFTSYIFKHTQKHSVHKWVHIAFSLLFQVFQNPNSMHDANQSPRSYSRISSTWDLPRMRYDQAQGEPKSCSRAWLWPPYHKSARPPPHSSCSLLIRVKHWCALLGKSKAGTKEQEATADRIYIFPYPSAHLIETTIARHHEISIVHIISCTSPTQESSWHDHTEWCNDNNMKIPVLFL